jgi:hypothetical protein
VRQLTPTVDKLNFREFFLFAGFFCTNEIAKANRGKAGLFQRFFRPFTAVFPAFPTFSAFSDFYMYDRSWEMKLRSKTGQSGSLSTLLSALRGNFSGVSDSFRLFYFFYM